MFVLVSFPHTTHPLHYLYLRVLASLPLKFCWFAVKQRSSDRRCSVHCFNCTYNRETLTSSRMSTSTQFQPPNLKIWVPSAECRVPSAECRVPDFGNTPVRISRCYDHQPACQGTECSPLHPPLHNPLPPLHMCNSVCCCLLYSQSRICRLLRSSGRILISASVVVLL